MLKQRLNSSLFLWVILLTILWLFQWHAVAFFILLAAIGGIHELLQLFQAEASLFRFNLLLNGTFLALFYFASRYQYFSTGILYVIAIALICGWSIGIAQNARAFFFSLFGFWYLTFNLHFFLKIAQLFSWDNTVGLFMIVWIVLITKATDIGGFCIGCSCGKHHFSTIVSPQKTLEGIGGGLLFAFLVHTGFYIVFHKNFPISFLTSSFFAILLSCGAILSDLLESLLKRYQCVKDSGQTIPGIGGILDLIDSLLLNAPFAYFLFKCECG